MDLTPKSGSVVTPISTDLTGGHQSGQQGVDGFSGPKPDVGNTPGGVDISDDGEDLSDSEKSRKKRR